MSGRQPVGVRPRPDHEEEPVGRDGLLRSRSPRSRSTRCSSRPSPPPSTTSVPRRTSTLRCRFDLSHEVLRHPRAERVGPDDQRDPLSRTGRGGARPARPSSRRRRRRRRARHARRLDVGAAVEHARAVQRLQRRGSRVAGTRRRWRAAPRGLRTASAVGQGDGQAGVVAPEIRDALQEGEVGAEDPRLLVRLPGEPATAHASREAEVVADQRARGRLPADARPGRRPGC